MRKVIILSTALALAACGGDAGSSSTEPELRTGQAIAEPEVQLFGGGVTVTGALGSTMAYGAPREATEAEIAKLLGAVEARTENEECGAGPMQFTKFAEGLTLNFQDDKLVGWFLSDDADGTIKTSKGIGLGSSTADFETAHQATPVEESTLGTEFYSDAETIGALAGEGEGGTTITDLYSGTNCFFR